MLTPGNKKLGGQLIWGFGLPSGRPEVCVGLSATCLEHCYARAIEQLRPMVLARYETNLRLSRLPDFEWRVMAFLIAHNVAIVRVHTGGDFFDEVYTTKWLHIMEGLPQVRFYCYTRSWRDSAILAVLEAMAQLRNSRVWFSCDRDTGLPSVVPSRVRLAWLMTSLDDLPPAETDLVFRIRRLRRLPRTRINGVRVCPPEDGIARRAVVTCEHCRLCWKPLPEEPAGRISLPLVNPSSSLDSGEQP